MLSAGEQMHPLEMRSGSYPFARSNSTLPGMHFQKGYYCLMPGMHRQIRFREQILKKNVANQEEVGIRVLCPVFLFIYLLIK